jgi:hypothetical protein
MGPSQSLTPRITPGLSSISGSSSIGQRRQGKVQTGYWWHLPIHCLARLLCIARVDKGDEAKSTVLARLPVGWHVDILDLTELAKVLPNVVLVHTEWDSTHKDFAAICIFVRHGCSCV